MVENNYRLFNLVPVSGYWLVGSESPEPETTALPELLESELSEPELSEPSELSEPEQSGELLFTEKYDIGDLFSS